MTERPVTSEKDIDGIISFLSEASIFKGLSPESLKKISEKIQIDSFAKDSTIIKKDSPGIRLYMIKSGSSRVVAKSGDEGEEFVVATIRSGECLGEMSLLTGEPCCATVKTNEDSLLYFLAKSDFDDIISENPLIYKHFNKLLAARINKQNIKSTNLKKHEIALNKYLQNTKEHQYSNVIGKSRKMRNVLQRIGELSKMDIPVTVIGEPGTGKELIARKIHTDSTRAKFPVIEIEIPNERRKNKIPVYNERRKRDQIECELFGNERMPLLDEDGKRIGRLELVEEGTLIIKNVENMPLSTQEKFLRFIETGNFSRVGGDEPIHANVRIITTTKDIDAAGKQLDPRLFKLLSAHKLEVPPLSGHKKDIPSLMEHFVEKINKTKHIQAKKFSKGATNKLLKYDYPGNVRELESVIERAVELSGGNEVIEEEEIFLGDVHVEDKNRLNLLNIPLVKRLCESQRIFSAVKIVALISFAAILYLLVIQPDVYIGGKNIALVLCWQLGLPLLFVILLFVARFGCSICPISSISRFFSKYVSLKIPVPSFIKSHDVWITGMGFVFILYLESSTHMAHSVTKTGYLIFSVLFGAIIVDLVFEKSAWCRHLCPLGGLSGLLAMSSLIEIRANRNTCATICTTHDCYKGSESAERCPMFLHLQFLYDNRNCKVCLNCIKNCKHHSPRLNLRIPGEEIGSLSQPSLAGATLSIILCGLLIAEILSELNIGYASFSPIFLVSILFALTMSLIVNYFTAFISGSSAIEHLKHFGYTLLPLALCGHIALKLTEFFGDAQGSLTLLNIYEFNISFTNIIQSLMVLMGFFITEYLIYKVVRNIIGKNKQFQTFVIQGILPLIFSAIYISLFYN